MSAVAPVGFEWDDEKYERNWQKHRVRFDEAIKAFDDDRGFDLHHQWRDGELRWSWLGMYRDFVLYIVYTERNDGDITRVISDRRAVSTEIDAYFAR